MALKAGRGGYLALILSVHFGYHFDVSANAASESRVHLVPAPASGFPGHG